MKKRKIILPVFFLSMSLIYCGSNFFIADIKVHHIMADNANTASEIPDNIFSSLWDDPRWLVSSADKPFLIFHATGQNSAFLSLKTIDFPGSVWQPPKFC